MIATRSMFTVGFHESPFRMGDDTLSQTDRDQILVKIDTAFRKANAIDTFAAKGVDKALSPANAAQFKSLLAQAGNIVGTVAVIQDRLQSQVASDWVADAVERQRVSDYATAVDQMTDLMSQPAAPAAKPGQAAPVASNQILGMPPAVVYVGGTVVAVGLLLAIFRPS